MSPGHDITFHSMGSEIRLIVGPALLRGQPSRAEAAAREQAYIEDFARRLSRFRPESELCAFNSDRLHEVPTSALLRTAVAAGLWAAERSCGLVDPTLVGELERVGYEHSQDGRTPASLRAALAVAPPARPARARAEARWRQIEIDDEHETVRRPPGVRIDTGGIGKGLAADAVAYRLRPYTRFVVDCGGDIAVGGVGGQIDPFAIEVEHPLTGECIHTLNVTRGGVATSGLNVRIWRCADGTFAHHLLDPSSGEPAWSGLIAATALAPTVLEAETLSKLALLTGAEGARDALAAHGGVVVHNDGDVELIGPTAASRRGPVELGSAA
jgi:thiamine biosynthesis lipoprotein